LRGGGAAVVLGQPLQAFGLGAGGSGLGLTGGAIAGIAFGLLPAQRFQLGRVGFGVELSPIYCDTTVTRWERLTGRKAVLAK